jgi:hypothetical protein
MQALERPVHGLPHHSRFLFFLAGGCFSRHIRHRSSEQYSQEKQSLQGNFFDLVVHVSGTYSLPGIPGMETNGMAFPPFILQPPFKYHNQPPAGFKGLSHPCREHNALS